MEVFEPQQQCGLILSPSLIDLSLYFATQSWTERAKGPAGDAADLRKRKRAEGGAGGGADCEDGRADAEESGAKKKKPLDTSSKLSAFAFNKS